MSQFKREAREALPQPIIIVGTITKMMGMI